MKNGYLRSLDAIEYDLDRATELRLAGRMTWVQFFEVQAHCYRRLDAINEVREREYEYKTQDIPGTFAWWKKQRS